MIFEDPSLVFSAAYEQNLQSPDLRPIPLPMSGCEKQPWMSMISFQDAATALPGSNPFGQYWQQQGYPIQEAGHYDPYSAFAEPDPENYSESDYALSLDHGDRPGNTYNFPVESVSSEAMENTLGNVQLPSRKRKASPILDCAEAQPQKRVVSTQLQVQSPNGECYDVQSQPDHFSPFSQASIPAMQYASVQVPVRSPRPGHHYSVSTDSQASLTAPSPYTPAWSPSLNTVKTEPSPRAPMTPIPRPASATSPFAQPHPKLVRTSTIPQATSPAVAAGLGFGHPVPHAFSPFNIYPHNKATLRLKGDLTEVGKNWVGDELEARRKLVVFTRSQAGSTIDAEFKVVAPEDWNRTDITVNCIYWKEKDQAFVTSVDTIALLEQLVAVRFTVEEKNRIRRNLEGFRPMTISKAKPDSEEFFKVIMGFPNPKPRNIEKDVKVFTWDILQHALKKIIGKYSASYASTAAMISPAAYAASESSVDYSMEQVAPQAAPPAAIPSTGSLSSYTPGMVDTRMPNPLTMPPGLTVTVPTMAPQPRFVFTPDHDSLPVVCHSMHVPPAPASAPPHQQHFDHYAWEQQARFAASSAPPTAAPGFGHFESAELLVPGPYQINHRA